MTTEKIKLFDVLGRVEGTGLLVRMTAAEPLHPGPAGQADGRVDGGVPCPASRRHRAHARLFPGRDGYRLIASSVTEAAWLEEIPADRPVLVIAEGLMMYLADPGSYGCSSG